jgi:hypothetical protein
MQLNTGEDDSRIGVPNRVTASDAAVPPRFMTASAATIARTLAASARIASHLVQCRDRHGDGKASGVSVRLSEGRGHLRLRGGAPMRRQAERLRQIDEGQAERGSLTIYEARSPGRSSCGDSDMRRIMVKIATWLPKISRTIVRRSSRSAPTSSMPSPEADKSRGDRSSLRRPRSAVILRRCGWFGSQSIDGVASGFSRKDVAVAGLLSIRAPHASFRLKPEGTQVV